MEDPRLGQGNQLTLLTGKNNPSVDGNVEDEHQVQRERRKAEREVSSGEVGC